MVLTEDGWMLAAKVAKRFGVKTATLRKWRQKGKGPQGWVYLAETRVIYPESEVIRFEAALAEGAARKHRPPQKGRAAWDRTEASTR